MAYAGDRMVTEVTDAEAIESIDDIPTLAMLVTQVNDALAPFETQITEKRAAIRAATAPQTDASEGLSPNHGASVPNLRLLRLYDEHYLLRHKLHPLMQ